MFLLIGKPPSKSPETFLPGWCRAERTAAVLSRNEKLLLVPWMFSTTNPWGDWMLPEDHTRMDLSGYSMEV